MQSRKFSLVRGNTYRVTRTDGCGRLVDGECISYVTDGFVSLEIEPRTVETEELELTKSNGQRCVDVPAEENLAGYDITATLCGVDPVLFEMMTKTPIIYDAQGVPVGYKANTGVDKSDHGFAIEVWSTVPNDACGEGTGRAYGYVLFPFLRNGMLGGFTIENAAITMTMTGLSTRSGTAWGTGPYDVTVDESGNPSPLLEPLDKDDHHVALLTTTAPPEETGECVASGPPATGATSGTPGTWTPMDSYAPSTLTELQASSITATPETAWTTGEYVVLGDGSRAHWNSTAWAAGAAS